MHPTLWKVGVLGSLTSRLGSRSLRAIQSWQVPYSTGGSEPSPNVEQEMLVPITTGRGKQICQLLAVAAVLAAAVLAAGCGAEVRHTPQKPNIIFVLTDDQFPGTEDMMPGLKNDITNEGVTFTNMVSTFPLCCPARATIQRGQYSHNTKIYGNSLPHGGWKKFKSHGEQRSTIATWLNGAGYQTGLFGKYMNNYTDQGIPPGWDRWYAWNGRKEGWTSVNDQRHVRPLNRPEADPLVAKNALDFLNHRLNKAAPVFAFVNFGAMHEPYYHAQTDNDEFKGE